MWVVGLIGAVGIAFLLVCLRGFHAALKEKHTIWAIVIKVEEEHAGSVPHRKSRPTNLPKAA